MKITETDLRIMIREVLTSLLVTTEGKTCRGCKGKKPGLWCNICRKRARGERPARPGEEGYPKTLDVNK